MTMTLDASPWGLGGILQRNVIIISWSSSPLSKHDQRIHKRRIGSSSGQQIWECLVYLVALRTWEEFWLDRRLTVTVRSDNIAALFLGAQMKAKASNLIAREVALVYSESSFEPRVFVHLPGVANVLADHLSRMSAPGYPDNIPAELEGVLQAHTPVRKKDWYKILPTS